MRPLRLAPLPLVAWPSLSVHVAPLPADLAAGCTAAHRCCWPWGFIQPALSASWLVAALRLIAGRLWGPLIVDLLWVPIWVQMLLAMDSSSPELAELLKLVCKTFW